MRGRAGNGNTVLVEACEFRQNFLHLRPRDAVILNVEPDHFDCYDSREALESAFARFAGLLPADGRLIVPWGDAAVQRVAASACCRIETSESVHDRSDEAWKPRYGLGTAAGSTTFAIRLNGPTGWLPMCGVEQVDTASISYATAES